MSQRQRTWIKDLKAGTEIEETFAVRSSDVRQGRGGGSYLAATIGDRSGEVTALVWQNVDRLREVFEPGNVVAVIGQVQRYNQQLQVVVRKAETVAEEQVDHEDFVRSSAVDPVVLWKKLNSFIEEVGDDDLQQLLFRIFSDSEVERLFKVAPAARGMHHAFRSGLLEHTVSVVSAAKMLAQHYGADQDLVVAGALLHDLGKIWELELGPSIEYTDDGRLLGHLPMEVLYVEKRISELEQFSAETRRLLLHILLSHHGEFEYGSPRRPKTPEALLVHMVDNVDSKMAGMWEAINADGSDDEAWTPYSRILGRFVYRRRPGGDE
ncbi:MAG: HD domain-containing protein [Acidobacteriota bacterium]|nr:HD domain-containing protein [Acidobacteriota bacterium]